MIKVILIRFFNIFAGAKNSREGGGCGVSKNHSSVQPDESQPVATLLL